MDLPLIPFTPASILVAPLNWGLGHATRSAGLVSLLAARFPDARIILASDGVAFQWLRQQFPHLTALSLPGYGIRYPKGGGLILRMVLSGPKLLRAITREHRAVSRIVRDYGVDLIISDNRYGLWSRKVYSVFITHQLRILPDSLWTRWIMGVVNRVTRSVIQRYDQCWVPDFAEPPGLAGDLSHPRKSPSNIHYIGPLSRFMAGAAIPPPPGKADLFCIISGPEPQRAIFLEMLLQQLEGQDIRAVIVAGTPGTGHALPAPPNVAIFPHLPDREMSGYMKHSGLVISRPGYTTIMDLCFTGGKAAFVPTPGQTEQEYLASVLMQKKIAFSMSQKEFNLPEMIRLSIDYAGFRPGVE